MPIQFDAATRQFETALRDARANTIPVPLGSAYGTREVVATPKEYRAALVAAVELMEEGATTADELSQASRARNAIGGFNGIPDTSFLTSAVNAMNMKRRKNAIKKRMRDRCSY